MAAGCVLSRKVDEPGVGAKPRVVPLSLLFETEPQFNRGSVAQY